MRSLLVALVLAAGCGAPGLNPDAAVAATAGCRPPGVCFKPTCDCTRPLPGQRDPCEEDCVFAVGVDMPTCECPTGDLCIEPVQECVGRAPLACPGVGARCLPKGSSCATPGGDMPDVVGVSGGDPDAGPTTEQRCPYVDDVCCPGMSESTDLGIPIDANLDQSLAD